MTKVVLYDNTIALSMNSTNQKPLLFYNKYLTDVVAPKIPINGTVIIHGHADVIGNIII